MRRTLGVRVSITVAATVLVGVACGSSVGRQEILAARAQGGAPGAGANVAAAGAGSAAGQALAGQISGAAPGSTAAQAGVPVSGTSGAGAPIAGGGAQVPSGVKLTASDVGITPTKIIVGNVSALSGALPPYPGPVSAIQALFNEINATGGILGRQLELRVIDDGLDPRRNKAAHLQLADKVFAFLGSLTLADKGGASVIAKEGVPDIGFALSEARAYLPTHARLGAQAGLVRGGKSETMARHAKSLGIKKIGVLFLNDPSAEVDANAFRKTAQAVGMEVPDECYQATQLVEPDYTSYILRLQQAGCEGFYFVADLNSAAHFQKDMKRQGWNPKFALYPLTIYENKFVELVGGPEVAEGASLYFDQVPFEDNNAELNRMAGIMKKYFPQYDPRAYGVVPNMQDTLLFLEALKLSGPNPTRKSFLNALASIRNFNANGLAPVWPESPLAKLSQRCWIVMTFHDGAWRRANVQQGWDCGKIIK